MRAGFSLTSSPTDNAGPSGALQAETKAPPQLWIDNECYQIELVSPAEVRLTRTDALNTFIDCSLRMSREFFLSLHRNKGDGNAFSQYYQESICARLEAMSSMQAMDLKATLFSSATPFSDQATNEQATNEQSMLTPSEPSSSEPIPPVSDAERAERIQTVLDTLAELKISRYYLDLSAVERLINQPPNERPEYFIRAFGERGGSATLEHYLNLREMAFKAVCYAAKDNNAQFDLSADRIKALLQQSTLEDWAYHPPVDKEDSVWQSEKKCTLNTGIILSEHSGFQERLSHHKRRLLSYLSDTVHQEISDPGHPFQRYTNAPPACQELMQLIYEKEVEINPDCWPTYNLSFVRAKQRASDLSDAVSASDLVVEITKEELQANALSPLAKSAARWSEPAKKEETEKRLGKRLKSAEASESQSKKAKTRRLRWAEKPDENLKDEGHSHFITRFHSDYYPNLAQSAKPESDASTEMTTWDEKSYTPQELTQIFWGLLDLG